MSQWISVEDELPPSDNCWVLVYADGAINCMGYSDGQWGDWTYAKAHNIAIGEITHWMPLPEAPV